MTTVSPAQPLPPSPVQRAGGSFGLNLARSRPLAFGTEVPEGTRVTVEPGQAQVQLPRPIQWSDVVAVLVGWEYVHQDGTKTENTYEVLFDKGKKPATVFALPPVTQGSQLHYHFLVQYRNGGLIEGVYDSNSGTNHQLNAVPGALIAAGESERVVAKKGDVLLLEWNKNPADIGAPEQFKEAFLCVRLRGQAEIVRHLVAVQDDNKKELRCPARIEMSDAEVEYWVEVIDKNGDAHFDSNGTSNYIISTGDSSHLHDSFQASPSSSAQNVTDTSSPHVAERPGTTEVSPLHDDHRFIFDDPELARTQKLFRSFIPDTLRDEICDRLRLVRFVAQQNQVPDHERKTVVVPPLHWQFEGPVGTDFDATAESMVEVAIEIGAISSTPQPEVCVIETLDDLRALEQNIVQKENPVIVIKGFDDGDADAGTQHEYARLIKRLNRKAPVDSLPIFLANTKSLPDEPSRADEFLSAFKAPTERFASFAFPLWDHDQIERAVDERLAEANIVATDEARKVFVKRLLSEAKSTGAAFSNRHALEAVFNECTKGYLSRTQTFGADDRLILSDVIGKARTNPRETDAYKKIMANYADEGSAGLREVVEFICNSIEAWQQSVFDPSTDAIVELPCNNVLCVAEPGLGKTTYLRLHHELLFETGVRAKDVFTELGPGQLITESEGISTQVAQRAIESSRGGTLFLDEADKLRDSATGKAAMMPILKSAEDFRGDTTVAATCYPQFEDEFFKLDPGMRSRFPLVVRIPRASNEALLNTADKFATEKGYAFSDDGRDYLALVLSRHRFGAGFAFHRTVRNLVEQAITKKSSHDEKVLTKEDVLRIMPEVVVTESEIAALPKMLSGTLKLLEQQLAARENDTDFTLKPNLALLQQSAVSDEHIRTVSHWLYSLGLLMHPEPRVLSIEDFIAQYVGQTKPKTKATLEDAHGYLTVVRRSQDLFSTALHSGPSAMYNREAVEQFMIELENDLAARRLCLVFTGEQTALYQGLCASGLQTFFTSVPYRNEAVLALSSLDELMEGFVLDEPAEQLMNSILAGMGQGQRRDFAQWVKMNALSDGIEAENGTRVTERHIAEARALVEQLTLPAQNIAVAASPFATANDGAEQVRPVEYTPPPPPVAVEKKKVGPRTERAELNTIDLLKRIGSPRAQAELDRLMMLLSKNGDLTPEELLLVLVGIRDGAPAEGAILEVLNKAGFNVSDYNDLLSSDEIRQGASDLAEGIQELIDSEELALNAALFWICSRCGNSNPACPYREYLEAGNTAAAGGTFVNQNGEVVETQDPSATVQTTY